MNILYFIPARGGSKGLPDKNIKLLAGHPVIHYSIAAAQQLSHNQHVCVSTDSPAIKKIAEQTGIKVPFLRPDEFASDTATTESAMFHALDYYAAKGIQYDIIILLQPTSPFRLAKHIKEALESYTEDLDMVVSVKSTHASPYFTIFEEEEGLLKISKKATFTRRQDCPPVFELNGAVYIINVNALREKRLRQSFTKIKKYKMDTLSSLDIDTPLDFDFCTFLLEKGKVETVFSQPR